MLPAREMGGPGGKAHAIVRGDGRPHVKTEWPQAASAFALRFSGWPHVHRRLRMLRFFHRGRNVYRGHCTPWAKCPPRRWVLTHLLPPGPWPLWGPETRCPLLTEGPRASR